jgi:hypothetical protein
MKYFLKVLRILGKGVMALLVLFLLVYVPIQFPTVQTWIVQKVTTNLSKTLDTKVEIGSVNIKFFKTISLQNIYIEDQQNDTLIYAQELDASIGLFSIFESKIYLNQITLGQATVHVNRSSNDSLFNFNFLLNAFSTNESQVEKDTTASNSWEFEIGNVLLQEVNFNLKDDYASVDLQTKVGELTVNMEVMDLKNKRLEFKNIALEKSLVKVIMSKPSDLKTAHRQSVTNDSSALGFPYVGWEFLVQNFSINESEVFIKNKNAEKSTSPLDVNDLALKKIKLKIEDFIWDKKNLVANIKTMHIQEKSGLTLKDFKANLVVTNQRIAIGDLQVNTSSSRVYNTTLIEFDDFGELSSNFYNITFTTNFSKTKIASNDLKYVVGALRELPVVDLTTNRFVKFKGIISGTLNDFTAERVAVEIENALVLKVNGTVKNMLESDKMKFDLNLKELSTSYEKLNSILKEVELPKGLQEFGVFKLQGEMEGKIAAVNVNHLKLETDANTGFDLTGKIVGLPDVKKMKLNLNIENIFTTADDLDGFVETGLPPMLDTLGKIRYEGEFDGSLTTFDLNGKLSTDLGILESDIFMNFTEDYSSADYKGDVRLNAFQLGRLLGDSLQLGAVTLNAALEGEGFAIDSLNAALKVKVEHLEYHNYEYKNILVDGLLEQGVFMGKLDLQDPNANIDFDGKVSFREEQPVYQFTMLVDTLNLEKLNLMEDQLSLRAKLDMNFSGKNIEDFDGEMNVTEIMINNQGEKFNTDSLAIKATRESSTNRNLTIESSFLTGEVKGDYNFRELPKLILAYINDYYPLDNFLSEEQKMVEWKDIGKPQVFELIFELKDLKPINIFFPQLSYMENGKLVGDFNSKEKNMHISLGADKILYDKIKIKSVDWKITGNENNLVNQLVINEIDHPSGGSISQVILKNKILNDSMYLDLEVGNDTIEQLLNIAASVTPRAVGHRLEFEKEMLANNTTWQIDKDNFIEFNTNLLLINELIFSYEGQSLGIHSLTKNTNESTPPINISFEDFQLREFSKLANIENTNFTGMLNGYLKVIDLFGNLHYTADLTIPDMVLNDEQVGALNIDLAQPVNSKNVNVKVLLKGQENNLEVAGDYNIETTQYDVTANVSSLQLRLIDPFVVGIVGQSKGTVNGEISLDGTPDQPKILGTLNLNQISTVIDFSKTRYTINEGQVKITNQKINLGTLTLNDRRGDQAVLSGEVTHDFFSNLKLDLKMSTDRFTFLNTEPTDNELFYGKLFLNAQASIRGVVESPLIEVSARTLEGSELNVSAFSEEDSFLEEDFIIFGNPQTYENERADSTQIAYEIQNAFPAEIRLNLDLTDAAIFRVIVDPLTGDQLEAKGNSALLINLLPSGEVSIFGNYVIQSGKYRFSYTDIIKRNFEIVQGSSVEFNGDPLNARFNVTAKYTAKATPFDLIKNETTLTSSEVSAAQQRQKVEVLMKMNGNLAGPELTFDLALPEAEGTIVSSEIQRKLVELRNEPNELNKQVFGLLLFEGFIVSSGGAGFGSTGSAVILGSVSNFVSKQLNQLADKYIKSVQINFDVSSYQSEYINKGEGGNVTELGVGVTKQFNDRLSIKAVGNVDFNSDAPATGFSQIAGDFVLEYKLTNSGDYLLEVFRKSDYDVLNEENAVKTGVGISVSKSFGGVKKN